MYAEPAPAARVESRAGRSVPSSTAKPLDVQSDLQHLFKSYDAACFDFDADAVAALYDLPCLLSTPDGNGSFTARGELRAAFARVFSLYRQHGLVSASLVSLTIEALSADFAQVLARWSLSNGRGVDVVSVACAYTLRHAGGKWRIAYAAALDDADKLARQRPRAPTLSFTPRI